MRRFSFCVRCCYSSHLPLNSSIPRLFLISLCALSHFSSIHLTLIPEHPHPSSSESGKYPSTAPSISRADSAPLHPQHHRQESRLQCATVRAAGGGQRCVRLGAPCAGGAGRGSARRGGVGLGLALWRGWWRRRWLRWG